MNTLNIIKVILEEGCKYSILALGVYLTYSILDFPDLSVDGTMPLGGIVSTVLILNGINPWFSLLVAFICGCLAGSVTGFLHVRLKIRPLLAGILVYTSLLSINLVIIKAGTGGSSIASILNKDTIFNTYPAKLLPQKIGDFTVLKLIVLIFFVIVLKILLDLYLKTKSGMLLRATGNNERFVTMLAKNPGTVKILGLALGNGLAAVSGAVIAQSSGNATTTMGTGMVVFGLSSVIIGISIFSRIKFMKATTMVILGTIIYKGCLQLAVVMELPSEYNKLLMAALFIIALLMSGAFKGKGRKTKNVKA